MDERGSNLSPWREGFWSLVDGWPGDHHPSTQPQEEAARYFIQNAPRHRNLGWGLSHEILCVRSYLLGLLHLLGGRRKQVHPRQAAYELVAELGRSPDILRDIRRWSQRRYSADSGPPRIGATKHAEGLAACLIARCSAPPPSTADIQALIAERLKTRGLDSLAHAKRVEITYDSGGDRTCRVISGIQLDWNWPGWAAYILDPATYLHVSAHCELRRAERTFNIGRILSAKTKN